MQDDDVDVELEDRCLHFLNVWWWRNMIFEGTAMVEGLSLSNLAFSVDEYMMWLLYGQ